MLGRHTFWLAVSPAVAGCRHGGKSGKSAQDQAQALHVAIGVVCGKLM